RAGDTRNHCLATELAFRADFTGNARHFRGETVQLVHHRVDRVFQLENLALDVDGDLAREVASRHCGRDLGDVAHLRGQVRTHCVHRVGEVFPGTRHVRHFGAATENALGADLARHATDF